MTTCSRNMFPGLTSEFAVAPVRHRKLLTRLARCQLCGLLCCCVEHRIEHESGHLSENCKKEAAQSSTSRRSNNLFQEKREWISASDPAFTSNLNLCNFPYICIYCKIVVDSEQHLKLLLKSGPQCPSKESHWIVPVAEYTDNNNRKQNLIMEQAIKKKSVHIPKKGKDSTPISSQNKCESSLKNEVKTPQQQFLSQLNLKSETCPLPQLSAEFSFYTSTPLESTKYDKIPQMLDVNFTPRCGQNIPGILCNSTGSQKSRENSSRKVTFSSDLKYIDCGTKYLNINKNHNDNDNLKLQESLSMNESSNIVCEIIKNEELHTPLTNVNNISPDVGEELLKTDINISTNNPQKGYGSSKLEGGENTIQVVKNLADSFQTQEMDQGICVKNVTVGNCNAQQGNIEHREDDQISVSKIGIVSHSPNEKENQTNEEREVVNNSIIGVKTEQSIDENCKKNLSEVSDSSELFYSGIESLTESNEPFTLSFHSKTNSVDRENSTFDFMHSAHSDGEVSCEFTDSSKILSEDTVGAEDQGTNADCKLNVKVSSTHIEDEKVSCLSQQNALIDNTIDSTATSETQVSMTKSAYCSEIDQHSLVDFSNIEPSCSFEKQNIEQDEDCEKSLESSDTSFRKIATAISSSWTLARKLISDTLGRKREDSDISDMEIENKPPKKRMKLCHTASSDLPSPEAYKFPVKWQCRPKPVSVYNYKIKARRPLPRMRK